MGNSRGWRGLFETPGLAHEVSFAALGRLARSRRQARLEAVLRQAKVRMSVQKAKWFAANFVAIQSSGGVEAVTRRALSLPDRASKYQFMDAFEGIGPKYARNVWMEIYDPSFRDSIAIDERIKRITRALGQSFSSYNEHEQFYVDIARDAGLEPWELDRLLYWFRDHFLKILEQPNNRMEPARV
jgi:hypothetical protein